MTTTQRTMYSTNIGGFIRAWWEADTITLEYRGPCCGQRMALGPQEMACLIRFQNACRDSAQLDKPEDAYNG